MSVNVAVNISIVISVHAVANLGSVMRQHINVD